MNLLNMGTLLRGAKAEKIALGAFECWDSLNIQGIARAAKETRTPVIFQATSMEYRAMGGPDALADIVQFYVNKYEIPAALHLDHGGSLYEVEECLEAGFSSVMLDASVCPFAENAARSGEAARMAHEYGASCEAELGHVGGGDGGDGSESALTEPGEAAEFVRLSEVDCLAVSIGTVHGEYRGKPELRLDRLEAIAKATNLPLVLHGGSGTPADQLQAAIRLGITKINICTDLNKACLAGVDHALKNLTKSLAGYFWTPAQDAVAAKTEELIRLFRCETK